MHKKLLGFSSLTFFLILFFGCGESHVNQNSNGQKVEEGTADDIISKTEENQGNSCNSTATEFSTYFGGNGRDFIRDVFYASDGSIYIAGGTESTNFPTTTGAYQSNLNTNCTPDATYNFCFDAFAAKFDPQGNLEWSTLVGGDDYDRAYAIEVDDAGYVYIAGRAGKNFPTTSGVVQTAFGGGKSSGHYGKQDGFLTKISPDGSSLVYSTYFSQDGGNVLRRKPGRRN